MLFLLPSRITRRVQGQLHFLCSESQNVHIVCAQCFNIRKADSPESILAGVPLSHLECHLGSLFLTIYAPEQQEWLGEQKGKEQTEA